MGRFIGNVELSNTPGGDRHFWRVISPLIYITNSRERITVYPGAVTDGASVPRVFWRIVPPLADNHVAAAMIHDQLYCTRGYEGKFSRARCDEIFHEALLTCGVSRWKAKIMHWAVRLGGGSGWARHTAGEVQEQMDYIEVWEGWP